MVVNELYYGPVWRDSIAPIKAESSGIAISDDIIAAALRNIYSRDFNPTTDIEPHLFREVAKMMAGAVAATVPGDSSLGNDPFFQALRHSTDVFSAFKVHRAQNDMAARLLDSNGNIKPFEQWRDEVLPIASHQCGPWLETEYNTAVLRARQAANWQQFQAEKDILPNLKWLPSTSPNPGADHRPFWNTILPVDHPFWDQHRPGDRWNCKCDLTSTDEPATSVPSVATESPLDHGRLPEQEPSNAPQPGLADNPGKSQAVFSDDHPYFPQDCKHCAFYNPTIKARLTTVFTARIKDCYHCPYIDGCMERATELKKLVKERKRESRKAVQGSIIRNADFPHDILVSRASIDEWENQPFMYMAEKHQMMLDIEKVIKEAEYIGTAEKHKDVEKVVQSHIFKTRVLDIDAYIIVREWVDGNFILHSISDAQDFEKHVKRK